MPILDPILQFNLSIITNGETKNDLNLFYANYLRLAYQHINYNYGTILTSIQFKNDFENCMPVISKYLKFCFKGDKDEFPNLYFTILYQNDALEKQTYDFQGDYYKYSIFNSDFYFYKLNLDNSVFRSWFFSDYPIAVLCIRMNQLKDEDLNQIIFELDLMSAASLTIVVCLSKIPNSKLTNYGQLIKILYEHLISEIHVTFDVDHYEESFYNFVKELIQNCDKFNYHFYFYVRYLKNDNRNATTDKNNSLLEKEMVDILKHLETKPRIKVTYFNVPIGKSFKTQKLVPHKKFTFNSHGFNIKDDAIKIKIFLSDVPLYAEKDEEKCVYSLEFANIDEYKYHCYIGQDDFLSSDENRVEVLYFFLKNNKNIIVKRYVDINDIHFMNPELYVKSQLFLIEFKSEINNKCIKIINDLSNDVVPKEPESSPKSGHSPRKKKKELSPTEKLEQVVKNSLYQLKEHHNEKHKETKFKFNLSQIYTAYEIIDTCIAFSLWKSDFLGSIYQIPTGEGKSTIIFLVAAAVAQMGRKVHIVTSNYFLANRDYNESYSYFKSLGLNSAALLHYNEVPFYNNIYKDPIIMQSNYPNDYFKPELFENSMSMNFDVCKEKSNVSIVFSTLTNFECFYLYMTERSKENIDEYYKRTVLLIDEADSILIDEITNGTFISRPLNTNCEKILSYIYNRYTQEKNVTAKKIYKEIKKWPECSDLSSEDVEEMFKEIDLVRNDKSFVDGKKYLFVETDKKPRKLKDGISQYREIVPFDFDNKGIIERNKKFSGFIEQFISIKEIIENKKEDVIFKDLSVNYLYISHPIYVKLYKNVFGVTGTIGDSYDKELILKNYKLNAKIMPKEYPYRCCNFPITLCENRVHRNKLIVDEIMGFNEKGFPVLVFIYSPQEVDDIKELIIQHPKFKSDQTIDLYKDQNIKIIPNKNVGKKGAISLGTNVCGRGFHIEVDQKHLHIIVSFYSTNNRTLEQAFRRTSSKNNFGSTHIICLKDEFISRRKFIEDDDLEENLRKMEVYKKLQKQFIDEFRKNREWIFDDNYKNNNIYKIKLSKEKIEELRKPKVNVNRITSFEYQYPFCMNYSTFLNIQSQKIFSLFNCPNCEFTWKLFRQYLREMILQSWSILINKEDRLFNYSSFNIEDETKTLIDKLKEYIPDDKLDVFDVFMHIFDKVYQEYQCIRIIPIIPSGKSKSKYENDVAEKSESGKFSRISLEFRPFKLHFKSGSRIRDTFKKPDAISYIEDPELKYRRSNTDDVFSITSVLDEIFDKICNILNDFLENHINLKLFLRRTLAGCEFGICYDFGIENIDEKIKELKNCLFDIDPIFVFCIYINSAAPFLAGILIFMLYYLNMIIKNLITGIQNIVKDFTSNGFKLNLSLIKFLGQGTNEKEKEKHLEKLSEFLKDKIYGIINRFKNPDCERYYYIIAVLTDILAGKTVEKYYDEGNSLVSQISDNLEKFHFVNSKQKKVLDPFFKIGFLTVLWLISHMLDFHFYFLHKGELKYSEKAEEDSGILKKNHSDEIIDELANNIEKEEKERNNILIKYEMREFEIDQQHPFSQKTQRYEKSKAPTKK